MLHEAIPAPVAALIKNVSKWPLPDDTYMAGGTAVAIYLNHRVSLDIDLFTDKEFYCSPITSYLGQHHTITITNAADRDTLLAIVDNIKFSLFNYPYPLLKPLIINPDYPIKLASPEDIAAMKVVAIIQRGIAKDFVDLKGLITAYAISLDYLISMIQGKYGVSEEYGYQVKKGLIYFDDAINSLGEVTLVRDGKKVRMSNKEWKEVEGFFKEFILGK